MSTEMSLCEQCTHRVAKLYAQSLLQRYMKSELTESDMLAVFQNLKTSSVCLATLVTQAKEVPTEPTR